MTDLTMYDAASLNGLADGTINEPDVWAGYIGGAATNVWTDGMWRRVSHKAKLPIYVARPDKTGVYCGFEAIMAIYKLGIPHATAVAVDLELLVTKEPDYIDGMTVFLNDFYKVLRYFNYLTWKYGSTSYLFAIPAVDGAWVATDSGKREQYNHSGVHATQYQFENDIDISIIHRFAVHHRLSESWGING